MPSQELVTEHGQLWWGRHEQLVLAPALIDKDTVDAGNTNYTTLLREGLALGQITSSKQLTHWNPYATDGSQMLFGFLTNAQPMSYMGAVAERLYNVIVGGNIKASGIIIPGEADRGISGKGYEILLRNQCQGRFLFDDDLGGMVAWKTGELATNTTLTIRDHRTHFTNVGASGSVTAILPAPVPGLEFLFTSVAAQNLVLDGPATGEFFKPSGNGPTLLPANDETVHVRAVRTATTPTYQYVVTPVPA
jgi:hypothetical protein